MIEVDDFSTMAFRFARPFLKSLPTRQKLFPKKPFLRVIVQPTVVPEPSG